MLLGNRAARARLAEWRDELIGECARVGAQLGRVGLGACGDPFGVGARFGEDRLGERFDVGLDPSRLGASVRHDRLCGLASVVLVAVDHPARHLPITLTGDGIQVVKVDELSPHGLAGDGIQLVKVDDLSPLMGTVSSSSSSAIQVRDSAIGDGV
ncbi:MAG: hypothetical protein QM831_34115 [Kofleriaceae bacterium]